MTPGPACLQRRTVTRTKRASDERRWKSRSSNRAEKIPRLTPRRVGIGTPYQGGGEKHGGLPGVIGTGNLRVAGRPLPAIKNLACEQGWREESGPVAP